jgi:hypothetical protein
MTQVPGVEKNGFKKTVVLLPCMRIDFNPPLGYAYVNIFPAEPE